MKKSAIFFKFLIATTFFSVASFVHSQQSVWRYVDDKTGQIIYSNVQIKGKKGSKVEVLEYPPATQPSTTAPGAPVVNLDAPVPGSPIPEGLLKQLQKGTPPAISLPPLPGFSKGASGGAPGAVTPSTASELQPALPVVTTKEPSWARTPTNAQQTPNWAKEPFSNASNGNSGKIDSVD